MGMLGRIVTVTFLAASCGFAVAQQAPSTTPPATPGGPPVASDAGPEQPLPFSHKIHVGANELPCKTCHTPSPSGEALHIPQAAVCMQCHQAAIDQPAFQKLKSYAQSNTTIPWVRIYELPSFVTFSHKAHLDQNVTCAQCHGAVRSRDRMFKETDLSMKWCVDCHTAAQAPNDCDSCHTLEQ